MTSSELKPDLQSTLVVPADPLLGAVIEGRYAIEKVLGFGGMGLVYRARHVILNKPLAIKVLRAGVTSDGQAVARFRLEAQTASAIGNEHIIDVVDFGVLPDGATYIAMELLEGEPLSRIVLRDGPMEIGRLVHVARQLCDAIGAAHGAGIVHRDLKPDNIFLVPRGDTTDFVKVLDFGIAKVGSSAVKITRAGEIFGTPDYMSPEQCSGQPVDGRSDIYSIGVILYELLTGFRPFHGETLVELIAVHLTQPPEPPSLRRPDCPEGLEAIIVHCLEKGPGERYQDCAELLADLDAFAAGIPTWIPPRPSALYAMRMSMLTLPPQAPPTIFLPTRPGHRALSTAALIALGALAVGGVTLGTYAWFSTPATTAEASAPVATLPPDAGVPETVPSPTIRLETEPSGAEIFVDGVRFGVTPLEIQRPEDMRLAIELRHEGYVTRELTISSTIRTPSLRLVLERVPVAHLPEETPAAAPPAAAAPPPTMRRPAAEERDDSYAEVMEPW